MDTDSLIFRQTLAGARAVGMLASLIAHGRIPPHLMEQAREIMAEWEATTVVQPEGDANGTETVQTAAA